MDVAIDFKDDPSFQANEVGNEWADWVLPAKTMTEDLTFAQQFPKCALSFRGAFP